jgi:hypothetical protein
MKPSTQEFAAPWAYTNFPSLLPAIPECTRGSHISRDSVPRPALSQTERFYRADNLLLSACAVMIKMDCKRLKRGKHGD